MKAGAITIKNKKFLGAFYCISAAIIWGLSFVAQKSSADAIEPFTFNTIRMVLGAAVLLPVIFFRSSKAKKADAVQYQKDKAAEKPHLIKGGLCCGLALCFGINLQQAAFSYLEAGRVGFITAFYMILVPVFGLVIGKKAKLNVWVSVALGLVGLYLLCVGKGAFSVNIGTVITFLGAIAFAIHILLLDHFCETVDPVKLSCAQFLVTAVISFVLMLIFENPSLENIKASIIPLLYTGIMSCGVAFTFQTFGQKYTEPAVASLLLCLESAFSLLFGWVILHENLGTRGLVGCAVMLTAVFLSQIQFGPLKKNKEA